MLVFSRYREESAIVDLRDFGLGLVKITIVGQCGEKIRLGISADTRIPVDREEVFWAKERDREQDLRGTKDAS